MPNYQSYRSLFLVVAVLLASGASAQERSHYQYWLELAAADQTYADRALEIGSCLLYTSDAADEGLV